MFGYNIGDPITLNYGVKLPKFLTSSPGVYRIIKNPNRGMPPILEFKYKEYSLPPKLYGEIPQLADFFYEGFKRRGYKGGVILTGEPGAGKTELAKIICNKGLKEGLRVIDLSNTKLDDDIITYLETLDDVILFFDEFAKIVGNRGQDKLLTLFSNPAGVKRIIVLTENDKYMVSSFIRNRPGRIRYSKHFDKVPLSTVKDYLEDKNVDEDFYKEVINLYKRMPKFAFDHLQAIVDEYLTFPNLTFKEILEVLNLDFITGIKQIRAKRCIVDKIECKIIDGKLPLMGFVEYHQDLEVAIEIPEEILKDEELLTKLRAEASYIFIPNEGMSGMPMGSPGQQSFGGQPNYIPDRARQDNEKPIARIRFGEDDLKEFVDERMVFEKGKGTITLEAKVVLSYEDKKIV